MAQWGKYMEPRVDLHNFFVADGTDSTSMTATLFENPSLTAR